MGYPDGLPDFFVNPLRPNGLDYRLFRGSPLNLRRLPSIILKNWHATTFIFPKGIYTGRMENAGKRQILKEENP